MTAPVTYKSAPWNGGFNWTRHWLVKGAEVLAYVDTHPATGLNAMKVSNLFVPLKHRGHNLGRQVIKTAMARFPGKDIVITPNPWKDEAVPREKLASIYSSLGFEKMAGERYKDLMIFRRPFAFKMGVKAAHEHFPPVVENLT